MDKSRIDIELDESLYDALNAHITDELEKEYPVKISRKGARLYPTGLLQLNLDGEDAAGRIQDGSSQFDVSMTLPVFDWASGFSYIACSCQNDQVSLEVVRCAHMWVAQKALKDHLDQLHEQMELSSSQGLLDELKRYSEQLDMGLSRNESAGLDVSSIGADTIKKRVIWAVDGELKELSAYVQSAHGDGWTPGQKISWQAYMERRQLWQDPIYHMVASLLDAKPHASGQLLYKPRLFEILLELTGTGLLFAEDRQKPITISKGSLSLKGATTDGRLCVKPYIGDFPIDGLIDEQGAFARSGECLFICPLDEKTTAFVQSLLLQKQGIDLEQKDILVDYLAKIDGQIPISFDPALIDTKLPAYQTLYLRLIPFQKGGGKVEVWVRPTQKGSYFPAASGPEHVLDTDEGKKTILRTRDFIAERYHATDLFEHLQLSRFSFSAPNIWFIRGVEDILDILHRLRSYNNEAVVVEWPERIGLKEQVELAPDIDEEKISVSVGESKDWLGVQGGVQIDGQDVDLKALLDALKQNQRFIQLKDGRWSLLGDMIRRRLEALSEQLDIDEDSIHLNPSAVDAIESMEASGAIELSDTSVSWGKLRYDFKKSQNCDLSLPVGLKATLRPYQKDGYDWMIRLYHWKKGACLADDMGLGKTVQTLATLLKLASEGPALVVAPTSLVNNWQRESQKFTPELRVHIYRDSLRTTEQIQSYGPGDLVIASYGLVLRDIEHFEAALWNAVIYDEAQALKNANAKTSKAMQKLKANWQLALSGTPIENHLGDLWSLFRTISPEILGGWTRFQRSYLFPIVKGQSEKAADRLQKRISPFILRRMKKDYLKDLPTKTTIDLNIDLSEDEQKIYDALRLDAIKMLETKANDDDSLQDEMESEAASEAKKRMQILSVLTRLRLSVLHPKLVHPDWKQGSSKLMAFLSLCQQALSNGHRILVFSQFTKLLELVQDELIKLNVSHTYLDGSLSGKERSQRVEAFQAGEFDVFLISLKAGGTGLTLTKADFVVHLDPWWNPAVQEQATDRVYRIGQKNPVTVYRLIVNNSIEEQIMRLQQDKSDLAEQILDTKRAIRVDKMLELLR